MSISPQRLTIYLYSAHRAVIFAIAQLSCTAVPWRVASLHKDIMWDRFTLQRWYCSSRVASLDCSAARWLWATSESGKLI